MAARCILLLCISCNVCLIVQVCSLQGVACEVPDDAVYTDLHRYVRIGESVALKCQFRGTALAVYWKKLDDKGGASTLVSWLGGDTVTGSCGKRPCSIMEMNENRSLVIKEVSIAEQGRYICRVANYKGNTIHNFTEISVFSAPKEPYPFINECLGSPDMRSNQTCVISTAGGPINISCTASGYFPDLDLFFLRNSQYIIALHSEETTNEDGKKNKSITIQASPSPESYVCVASDIPGVASQRAASLFVTVATTSVYRAGSTLVVDIGIPSSDNKVNAVVPVGLYLPISVSVAVVIVLTAILVYLKRKKKQRSRIEATRYFNNQPLPKTPSPSPTPTPSPTQDSVTENADDYSKGNKRADHEYEEVNAPSRLDKQECDQEDDESYIILHHSYADFPSTEEREASQVSYSKRIFKGSEMEAVTETDQTSDTI